MRGYRLLLSWVAVAALAAPAAAQLPTGVLTGHIEYDNAPLAGVSVSLESEALQGTRSVLSNEAGDYFFRFLPPGLHQVTFSRPGFRTQTAHVTILAAQTRILDAAMYDETFTDEIVVSGVHESISTSQQGATTFGLDLIEKLAVDRDLAQAIALSPGISGHGPGRSGISISGAQSYDNLLMINGVVITESIRGQVLDLYIEDALQEITVQVSSISAEYGRFQGGVVNALTKAGGNQFTGSLRLNLSNDAWIASNELSPERVDDLNRVYEATLGGYALRDRLWFFVAGRDESTSVSNTTSITMLPYTSTTDEQRLEGKLTWSVNANHRLVGSYIKSDKSRTNTKFGTIYDYASLNPNRKDPQELWILNYTGVVHERLFVEAQISERFFGIGQGAGSPYTDVIRGTLLLANGGRFHTPTFCSAPECPLEERNNEGQLVKVSAFLSSHSHGSHDLVFGYDRYNDILIQNNHQQGSDFRIYCSDVIIGDDGYPYPVLDYWTLYVWTPIFEPAQPTDFITETLFVNDTWRLNPRWTFNLGMRYDSNDGTDSSGSKVADDWRLSPRLGASFDVFGDGELVLRASYGHYVTGITQTIANTASVGGRPASVRAWYDGPWVNTDPDQPLVNQEEAIRIWYEWFLANGGTSAIPGAYAYRLPGYSPRILSSLESPYTEELSIGASKRLGNRGMLRADYVRREGHDFYVTRIDTTTGTVDAGEMGLLDLALIENDSAGHYERVYDGLHTQIELRISDTLNLGGTWTWSHARGNFDGETGNNGPVTGELASYPEYHDASWNAPRGDLAIDQRHKVRAWLLWDAIATERHGLVISLLQSFFSGAGYSAIRSISTSHWVTNPGYQSPEPIWDYYFSGRGEYRWDDITRTDLALNYSFYFNLWGTDVELFIQPEVLNLFDEEGQTGGDTSIRTLQSFDPWNETPVEGVNWEKRSTYGQPRDEDDFQTPRTFRLSVGIRF